MSSATNNSADSEHELADRIYQNLLDVRRRIAKACQSSKLNKRKPEEITLLAVSKKQSLNAIAQVIDNKHYDLAENRVQELFAKHGQVSNKCRWHLIGTLQRNKVRKILPLVHSIHSVDSLKLANKINDVADELSLRPKVFLQINLVAENSKSGFILEEFWRDFDILLKLPRLEIQGLMLIPPFNPDAEKTRTHFAKLRELQDEISETRGIQLQSLSMGMSHDFEVAIEEGATHIRVGTAIFGKRG